MYISPIDSRLAAQWHQRQIEVVAKADAIAQSVGRFVANKATAMLSAAIEGGATYATYERLQSLYSGILGDVVAFLRPMMRGMVRWSDRDAADRLARTVPRRWWRLAYPLLPEQQEVMEARPPRRKSDRFKLSDLFTADNLLINIEPALKGQGDLSDDEYAALVKRTLIPPLSESKVEEIVKSPNPKTGDSWEQRIESLSAKVQSPERVAGEIVQGMAMGENVKQIRDRIDNHVGKLHGSSMRIARTEARRVAEAANRETWKALGDLLDGAQIVAVLDERTRTHHAARHGTIYRKGGSPDFAELPMLPDEPNCRCTAVPVLKLPSEVRNDPKVAATFANAKDETILDPAAYDDWFAKTDERRQRAAVGSRRFDIVKAALPKEERPEWQDFIGTDGKLQSAIKLKRETPTQRTERKTLVSVMLRQREDAFRQVATRPFTFPQSTPPTNATAALAAATPAQQRIIKDIAAKVVSGKLRSEAMQLAAARAAFPEATEDFLRQVIALEVSRIVNGGN